MKTHIIKCEEPFFDDIITGQKKFEIRFNDRNYQEGDQILLRAWHPETGYDGGFIYVEILYVLTAKQFPGLKSGYVCMTIEITNPEEIEYVKGFEK